MVPVLEARHRTEARLATREAEVEKDKKNDGKKANARLMAKAVSIPGEALSASEGGQSNPGASSGPGELSPPGSAQESNSSLGGSDSDSDGPNSGLDGPDSDWDGPDSGEDESDSGEDGGF
jgi:single-stranded DNA-binding protein